MGGKNAKLRGNGKKAAAEVVSNDSGVPVLTEAIAFGQEAFNQENLESLRCFLRYESTRNVFLNYLKSQYAEENLLFWIEIEQYKELCNNPDVSEEEKKKLGDRIYDEYVKANAAVCVNLSHELRKKTEDKFSECKSYDALMFDEAQEDVFALMAAGPFRTFVRSEDFLLAIEPMKAVGSELAEPLVKLLEPESRLKIFKSPPTTAELWLREFVGVAEFLPYCVCLTDMTLPDQPVVYINKKFEDITLYKREDVVGKNCRFLQGDETEKDVVKAIREAINSAKPLRIQLTNYRSDGERFVNLLSMKPIFWKGKLKYFISVQFDVTSAFQEEVAFRRLSVLGPFFDLLPSNL